MQQIDPKTLAEYRLFAASLQDPKCVPSELVPAYHRWAFANFMARRAQELEMLAAQALNADPSCPEAGQRWKFYQSQRIAAHKDAVSSERAYFTQRQRTRYIVFSDFFGDEPEDSPQQDDLSGDPSGEPTGPIH